MPEPQARPLDPMAGLLLSIKSGSKNLKSVPAEALTAKASKPGEVRPLLLQKSTRYRDTYSFLL